MVYTVINNSGNNNTPQNSQTSSSGEGFWNLDLELQALKTILTPLSEWSNKVYSVCKPTYFHHSTTKTIFNRLIELMESSKTLELPTLDFVLSDSKISPAVRETITESLDEVSIVKSQGDYDILISGLVQLAKARSLYKITHTAANDLLDSATPTNLVKSVSDQLGQSLFNIDDDEDLLAQISMGKPYNQAAEDSFQRLISGVFEGVKIKTGFEEFDQRTGGFHRSNLVILGANSGGGKCQYFQGLIPTNDGIQQIGDIYNRFSQDGVDGWIKVPENTLSVYTRQGFRFIDGVYKTEGQIYDLKTKWGDEFGALGEHKLYCFDNQNNTLGYKRIDTITKSDWILKAVGTHLFSTKVDMTYTPKELEYSIRRHNDVLFYPERLSDELATLFGLIVAEGHRAISFCNTDTYLLNYVTQTIQTLFGCVRNVAQDGHTIYFYEILSNYFSHFLGDVKSDKRFVPKCIMQAPEDIQCAFLRGYYEGDGCIYEVNKGGKKGKNSNVWSLECTSISKKLVYDIKALLENIGIYCRVIVKKAWASNGTENQREKSKYILTVLRESYELLEQKIGFMSERKKTELRRCIEHTKKMISENNTNYFVSGLYNQIPNKPVIDYINRVFDLMKDQTITVHGTAHGIPTSYQAPVGKYHIFYPNNFVRKILKDTSGCTSKYTANLVIKSHFGYSTRNNRTGEFISVDQSIRELIENDPILKELREKIRYLCSQTWANVEFIEKKDEVVPVYDLSVPEVNEYAANGLMSHNSLMAVNMLIRQYRLGYNTTLCSYEMSDDEVMLRVLSNISEVEMNKIQNHALTPIETQRATAAWREFNLLGYEKNNGYHIICPKNETTVSEIGFRVRNLKPDVLILDYINLLSSASGTAEAQWQQLGEISRESKLLANKLNCVVILLAQVDDTYNLRYSKAIKDHANFVMAWIRDDTARAERMIDIHQIKARNSELYNFKLVERFDIAQFRDREQPDRVDWPTEDELMMMELKCQSLGLKLEPTVSKEFDAKQREEQHKKLISTKVENEFNDDDDEESDSAIDIDINIEDTNTETVKPDPSSLLFSAEDAIPSDFSKLKVISNAPSILKDNPLFEDTV